MTCENQISTEDLENAKQDAVTLGEIATSRQGAEQSGTPITQSTNRFGETTDTIQGRLNKLGVIFDDPVRDWSPSLLVDDLRAHRYPPTTGDIYIPTKPLPFTTGASFNSSDWELYQGLDTNAVDPFLQTKNYLGVKTLSQAVADLSAYSGAWVKISDRGLGLFKYAVTSTVNGFNRISCTGVPSLMLEHQQIGSTEINAVEYGAIADSDHILGGGTDNLPVALVLNDEADAIGGKVKWSGTDSNKAYRFSGGWPLKRVHTGEISNTNEDKLTKFIFDSATPKTIFTNRGLADTDRAADMYHISIRSLQDRIHKLFETNYYRGGIFNCDIRGFDVAIDVEGVYVKFGFLNITDCNKGIYPRPLTSIQKPSTMFTLDQCVFLGNDKGIVVEDRGVAPGEDENLLGLHLSDCGFEQNNTGIEITERTWYFTTENCWSEANTNFGLNIPVAQYNNNNSRWDDTNILPDDDFNTYCELLNGSVNSRDYLTRWKGQSVSMPSTSTIIIDYTGAVVSTNAITPQSVTVQGDNSIRVLLNEHIRYPSIKVTGVTRNKQLTGGCAMENTTSSGGVAAFGTINRFDAFTRDSSGVNQLPDWFIIEISWQQSSN